MNNTIFYNKFKKTKNIAKKINICKEEIKNNNYQSYINEMNNICDGIENNENDYKTYNFYNKKINKIKMIFSDLFIFVTQIIYHIILLLLCINNFYYCILPLSVTLILDITLITKLYIPNINKMKKDLKSIKDFNIDEYNNNKYILNVKKDLLNKLIIEEKEKVFENFSKICKLEKDLNNTILNNNYKISTINNKSKKRVLTRK